MAFTGTHRFLSRLSLDEGYEDFMDNRVAQNALNFFLSKKFKYDGTDFMAIVEIVRELQAVVASGQAQDTPGGTATE